MKFPRFTIQRLMVVVLVVALLLASVMARVAITKAIKHRMAMVAARFNHGTTSAGMGVPPDR